MGTNDVINCFSIIIDAVNNSAMIIGAYDRGVFTFSVEKELDTIGGNHNMKMKYYLVCPRCLKKVGVTTSTQVICPRCLLPVY